MIIDNPRIRFCDNNFIESGTILSYSSQLSSFPFSNSYNDERSSIWKPSGCFEITSSNNLLHFNDGSDKSANIALGKYSSPSSLASEIQTKLNAVSTNFTVTYESSYKFKIVRSVPFTFKLSNATNAIHQDIGFTSLIDSSSTTFTADVVRIHTSEYATFDFGYARSVDFIGIVGPVDEIFSLSSSAIVKIYGNNINDFSTAPLIKTLTRYDGGVLSFIDDVDSAFRYWKIEVIDKDNTNGPQCFSVGNLYIGDYETLRSRNLENGFSQTFYDKSEQVESQSGALFFDKRPKYKGFDGVSLGFLDKTDRKMFDSMFQRLGKTTPFYVSFDPRTCFSDDLDEFTKLVVFDSEPKFNHVVKDVFSIAISMRECV